MNKIVILSKVTDLIMEPTIREWWLDILRSIGWWIIKGCLFIVDILYDIVRYIVTLDFLSSTEFGEFYDKYKFLLIIFLTIAMMVLGVMIMNADSNSMQKNKLRNALYGVMLLFVFSTIYPLLNQLSLGFNEIIGYENTALSIKLVQSSTKKLSYADGKVIAKRDITEVEAKSLLQRGSMINDNSGYEFGKDAYDYDIAWLQLVVVAVVMIFALVMLGYNAFKIIIDIGWLRVLSIIGLPLSLVSEGTRKKFILETFKSFVALPVSLLSFAFFLTASDWVMSFDIFLSDILIKYKGTFAEGYVSALFFGMALAGLAWVVLDGSSRTTGLLGIDTGIKSPAGAFAMLRAGQGVASTAKSSIGLGKNAVRFGKGVTSAGTKAATSTAGFAGGIRQGLKDKKTWGDKGFDMKNPYDGVLKDNEKISKSLPKNSKVTKAKNSVLSASSRHARGAQSGYNTIKKMNAITEKTKKRRGDKK